MLPVSGAGRVTHCGAAADSQYTCLTIRKQAGGPVCWFCSCFVYLHCPLSHWTAHKVWGGVSRRFFFISGCHKGERLGTTVLNQGLIVLSQMLLLFTFQYNKGRKKQVIVFWPNFRTFWCFSADQCTYRKALWPNTMTLQTLDIVCLIRLLLIASFLITAGIKTSDKINYKIIALGNGPLVFQHVRWGKYVGTSKYRCEW